MAGCGSWPTYRMLYPRFRHIGTPSSTDNNEHISDETRFLAKRTKRPPMYMDLAEFDDSLEELVREMRVCILHKLIGRIGSILTSMEVIASGKHASKCVSKLAALSACLWGKIRSDSDLAGCCLDALWCVEIKRMDFRRVSKCNEVDDCLRLYKVVQSMIAHRLVDNASTRAWRILHEIWECMGGRAFNPAMEKKAKRAAQLVFGVVSAILMAGIDMDRRRDLKKLVLTIDGLQLWAESLNENDADALFKTVRKYLARNVMEICAKDISRTQCLDCAQLLSAYMRLEFSRNTKQAELELFKEILPTPSSGMHPIAWNLFIMTREIQKADCSTILEELARRFLCSGMEESGRLFIAKFEESNEEIFPEAVPHVLSIAIMSYRANTAVLNAKRVGEVAKTFALKLGETLRTEGQESPFVPEPYFTALDCIRKAIKASKLHDCLEVDLSFRESDACAHICAILERGRFLLDLCIQRESHNTLRRRFCSVLDAFLISIRLKAGIKEDACNVRDFRSFLRIFRRASEICLLSAKDSRTMGNSIVSVAKFLLDRNVKDGAGHAYLGGCHFYIESLKLEENSDSVVKRVVLWLGNAMSAFGTSMSMNSIKGYFLETLVDVVVTSGRMCILRKAVCFFEELMGSDYGVKVTLAECLLDSPEKIPSPQMLLKWLRVEMCELRKKRGKSGPGMQMTMVLERTVKKCELSGLDFPLHRMDILQGVLLAWFGHLEESESKIRDPSLGDNVSDTEACALCIRSLVGAHRTLSGQELCGTNSLTECSINVCKALDIWKRLDHNAIHDVGLSVDLLVQSSHLCCARGLMKLESRIKSLLRRILRGARLDDVEPSTYSELLLMMDGSWRGYFKNLGTVHALVSDSGRHVTVTEDLRESTERDLDEAIAHLREKCTQPKAEKSEQIRILYNVALARLFQRSGRLGAAFATSQNALKLVNGYRAKDVMWDVDGDTCDANWTLGASSRRWKMEGTFLTVLMLRGELLEEMGLADEARSCLAEAEKVAAALCADSTRAAANLLIAEIQHKKGNVPKSRDHLRIAKKILDGIPSEETDEFAVLMKEKAKCVEGCIFLCERKVEDALHLRWASEDTFFGPLHWEAKALEIEYEILWARCHEEKGNREQAFACLKSAARIVLDGGQATESFLVREIVKILYHACRLSMPENEQQHQVLHIYGLCESASRVDELADSNGREHLDAFSFSQALKCVGGRLGLAALVQTLLKCWNASFDIPKFTRDIACHLGSVFAEMGKLHVSFYFMSNAVNPTLRLQKHTRANDSPQRDVCGVLDLLEFSEVEISDDVQLSKLDETCKIALENTMARFKKGTAACVVSHHPVSKRVMVGRYTMGKLPIIALVNGCTEEGGSGYFHLSKAASDLDMIIEENRMLFSEINEADVQRDRLRKWWARRIDLDAQLQALIERMDKSVVNPCKWLFWGEMDDSRLAAQKEAEKLAVSFSKDGVPGLVECLRLIVVRAESQTNVEFEAAILNVLRSASVTLNNGVSALIGLAHSKLPAGSCINAARREETPVATSRRRSRRLAQMEGTHMAKDGRRSILGSLDAANGPVVPHKTSNPVVLVLDRHSQALPWESLPSLAYEDIYRAPNLAVASCLATRRGAQGKEGGAHNCADILSTFYVLNPEGDLPQTQHAFHPLFKEMPSWRGKAGEPPSALELQTALGSHDMYIYLGHNCGEKYMDRSPKSFHCRSAGFIMGCGSGRLIDRGEYDPSGPVLEYMQTGSPAIVANLWLVSDLDINRFSKAVLNEWVGEGEGNVESMNRNLTELSRVVARSRLACRLPHLVGAAPVCYGAPLAVTGVARSKIGKVVCEN